MNRVFIATPYRATDAATLLRNRKYALSCLLDSTERGEAPFASHLLYPQVLSDADPDLRDYGIRCGICFLEVCHVLAVYEDYGISEGMGLEIQAAQRAGIPIVFRSLAPNPKPHRV